MTDKYFLVSAGAFLREMRKNKGLSLFKVAKHINISGNYLSEIERGKKNPSDLVLEALAEYYELDIQEVFERYDRVHTASYEEMKKHPELLKVIRTISTDKRINNEELDTLANELYSIYQDIIKKKGDD